MNDLPCHATYADLALENMATALLIFDSERALRWMNPAAQALFQIGQGAMSRAKATALFQAQTELQTSLGLALEARRPHTKREAQLHTAAGEALIVDALVTPLTEGSARAVLVEFTPVERRLRISREEELLELGAATRTLTRGLAHEIKNPLGGLRGAAQLLERELPNAEWREYVRVIIDEADRLQNLVDRMLGPRVRAAPVALNLHEVLERVCALVRAEIGDRIAITRDYDPSMPEFMGDMDMLIQAVLNLARNAVEAIDRAPPPAPRIELRTRTQRQYTIGAQRRRLAARVDIIDNGPGVPETLAGRLFYPMVTGRKDGSGLGLSIAQTLIHHHHGLIEYESRPGHTVFTLLLPLTGDATD